MDEYKTEQEEFWANEFGDQYLTRHIDRVRVKTVILSRIFHSISKSNSLIEFGANVGLNIKALSNILRDDFEYSAVEINKKAVVELKKLDLCKHIYHKSILDFNIDYQRDIVLVSGVLIHMDPEVLIDVYQKIYKATKRYIIIREYYNPTPVEVEYRNHKKKLFKRDFAGEMLDKFCDLELVDYGFDYRKDNNFPGGDGTWFLLKKD